MMVFKEITEHIADRKSNAMKIRNLLFAYGPVIYQKKKKKPGKRWPQQQKEDFAT